jgi:hypothetical protein
MSENRVPRRIFGPKREGRGVYRVLVRRPLGKRPLGRPRHRWEDNIKMDLRRDRWGELDSSGSG